MKKFLMTVGVLFLFACLYIYNNQPNFFSDTPSSGDDSDLLPLYEFSVEDIPDCKMDISNLNIITMNQEISTTNEALEYGGVLFDEMAEQLSLSSELKPIAIIRDKGADAWGISFGTGGVGDGYSIAFYNDGRLIAMWPEE